MLPRIAVIAGVAALAVVAVVLLLGRDGETTPVPVKPDYVAPPPGARGEETKPFKDPFSYDPGRRRQFELRAAAGNAHVLYALSPGGAAATAKRVAAFRPAIDRAAKAAGVSADTLEALVFLESAGRPDVLAPTGTEGAAGLTQIVAETGINLLGMKIDIERSRRLTKRLFKARSAREAARLAARRRSVDERFAPVAALAATGRYLALAEARLKSEELAFVSYHMGIGNLESVLAAYAGGKTDEPLRYAQVYFDSSPTSHRAAYAKLYALGDDSSNYLWKLHASRGIMRLYRTDPGELDQIAALQTAKNSAEEVLHPSATTEVFATPAQLAQAWDAGELVPLGIDPRRTGLRVDPRMGALARKLGRPRTLYRGLRPEAMAMALFIGAQTRAAAGDPRSTLTVTSTVRDQRYQRELVKTNFQATRNFSMHTTGFALDILRRYRSPAHARAFQAVLDRLKSLNLIAWVREPAAIHIAVSSEAAALMPLLDRVTP